MESILNALALPAATALMVTSAIVIHNYQVPVNILAVPQLYSLVVDYLSSIKDAIQAHIENPSLIVDSSVGAVESVLRIENSKMKEDQFQHAGKVSPQRQTKLERLFNPPMRTAFVASVIFLLSVQYIHELHQADRYRNQFLLTGLIVGVNASAIAWFLSPENIFAFKTLVPGSVISALVLSSLAHRLIIAREVEKDKKNQ